MHVRKATARDAPAIAAIIVPIIREAATYTLNPDMSESEALAYWMGGDKETFVAEEDGAVLGTLLHAAKSGRWRATRLQLRVHTHAAAAGRGVARGMCEHSLEHARSCGYRAMQFNFVVSTNERAVRLWQSLGFEIVGRLPAAFRHPVHGYVDALVMYRLL